MSQQQLIKDREQFQQTATKFFNVLFEEALKQNCGDIEISGFENGPRYQTYHNKVSDAVNDAYHLCQQGLDVYMGVNPRIGDAGKKENIEWLTAFHAEIDYGKDGHKKQPVYTTYEMALEVIKAFDMPPTWVNHSGGGFHCYWVLNQPVKVADIGVDRIENVNKALTAKLKGDYGTQNINRIFRVPGTFNFKLQNNPREVKVVTDDGPKYDIDTFKSMMNYEEGSRPRQNKDSSESVSSITDPTQWDKKISSLPVSDRIKLLIIGGKDKTYPSRSEADQAVITALVNKGMGLGDIKTIFENYRIGEKYREHSAPDGYLEYCVKKAAEFTNLTEEERQDPLFISGALHKDDNGKYHLMIVPFQEFMNRKHRLKFLEKERAFFTYNGKCYEQCSEDRLNNLCQTELRMHRGLFSPASKNNFIHFAIGNDLVDAEKGYADQGRYLTMQNGLYDIDRHLLRPHDPVIFTTNLLPYDFDEAATCPRWLQYLDEVFMSDAETIKFIQEAVGYAFEKSIPKASLFFMIGDGGNGKSVFIHVISSLCGKENHCNISLNKLNDEKYLLELFGKMINVSDETPSKKCMNTDLVKSVVSGDWVTGREVYKRPSKFKPYAKHYLGMNTLPDIDDNTHGMWRRIYVIEFPRKFADHEMDVMLMAKLHNELSGIFNWALEGYMRLRGQGFIFTESKSMRKSKTQYKQQNNSALDFVANCLENADQVECIPLKDLHDRYQTFCTTEKYKNTFSKREFRHILELEGYRIENSKKHANQVRVFGVRWAAIN